MNKIQINKFLRALLSSRTPMRDLAVLVSVGLVKIDINVKWFYEILNQVQYDTLGVFISYGITA